MASLRGLRKGGHDLAGEAFEDGDHLLGLHAALGDLHEDVVRPVVVLLEPRDRADDVVAGADEAQVRVAEHLVGEFLHLRSTSDVGLVALGPVRAAVVETAEELQVVEGVLERVLRLLTTLGAVHREHAEDLPRGGIDPAGLEGGTVLPDALLHVRLVGEEEGTRQVVTLLAGPPVAPLAGGTGREDRHRCLQGLREELVLPDVPERALVGDGCVGRPERSDDLGALAVPVDALFLVEAEDVVCPFQEAPPDAVLEPAAGQHVEHRVLFGDPHRVVERQE